MAAVERTAMMALVRSWLFVVRELVVVLVAIKKESLLEDVILD